MLCREESLRYNRCNGIQKIVRGVEMKIATYNIWNDEATLELRAKQIIEEIRAVEVSTEFYNNHLVTESGYVHHAFMQYPGEEEGLAMLSHYPLIFLESLYQREQYGNSLAMNAFFMVDGVRFSLTNVHLPWNSVSAREYQILAIDRHLREQNADFHILLGDFNSDTGSSTDRYLCGEQTLHGCEANPCWNDLAKAYAARMEENVKATLDTVYNPRWAGKNSISAPKVMDRIYIRNHWNETELESVRLFGTTISKKTGYAASDHYGVVADVTFRK